MKQQIPNQLLIILGVVGAIVLGVVLFTQLGQPESNSKLQPGDYAMSPSDFRAKKAEQDQQSQAAKPPGAAAPTTP
jgi:hypothetical protein